MRECGDSLPTLHLVCSVQQTTNLHEDSDECIVTELSGFILVDCGWESVCIANVHDECALLLVRLTTSPFRLVIYTICCNMLKSVAVVSASLFVATRLVSVGGLCIVAYELVL